MSRLRLTLKRYPMSWVAILAGIALLAGIVLVVGPLRPRAAGAVLHAISSSPTPDPLVASVGSPSPGVTAPASSKATSRPGPHKPSRPTPNRPGVATATPGAANTPSPSATATPGEGSSPSPGSTPAASPTPGSTPGPSPTPPPAAQPVARAGINVEPSMRPTRYYGPNPDGWWCVPGACNGVANGTVFVDAEMNLIGQLGVHTLRLEFPWALMEPTTQGTYDWSRSDYIVNAANRDHVNLVPIIVFTPHWESAGLSDPPKSADFQSFATALVGRYKGSIHTWEMWNEPDLATYFSGSEAQYVSQVLVPGFNGVRAADPSAKVVLGGPSGPNQGWLNGIYSLGGGQSFDIMAFHDYASSAGQIIADAGLVLGVLQQHGQGGKPVWLGEYGQQESAISDVGQQALLTGVVTGSSPIAMAQWYNLRDDFSMLCCPPSVYKAAYWGLVQHDDVTLKQGYGTLQQLIRQGY